MERTSARARQNMQAMGYEHQWREDQDPHSCRTRRRNSISNHASEPCTARGGVFPYLESQMEATGKVEKEVTSRIEKAETVYLEEKSLSKPQPEERRQDEGFSNPGDASTAVWY